MTQHPKPTPIAIDGILLLNKAPGVTSNVALQQVKRLLGAKKAGHTGSLDPLATGMLPLCFGEATKISQFLLDADKIYETTGLLGLKTTTADSTGEVLEKVDNVCVTTEHLVTVLEEYTGRIKQIPSMYSALKHKGKPLYRYAREGKEVAREAREVEIKHLQLMDFDGLEFALTVGCSKGTYIRNLVEDIGATLKVGAHVKRLHRVCTTGFQNLPMYTLADLQAFSQAERLSCLLPMDRAVEHLPMVNLTHDEVIALRQGRTISKTTSHQLNVTLRLYDEAQQFVGLGALQPDGLIKAKRLLSFNV